MINFKFMGYEIIFDEDDESWVCEDLNIQRKSLNNLKAYIIDKRKPKMKIINESVIYMDNIVNYYIVKLKRLDPITKVFTIEFENGREIETQDLYENSEENIKNLREMQKMWVDADEVQDKVRKMFKNLKELEVKYETFK